MTFNDGYHDNAPALVRAALREYDREVSHPTPFGGLGEQNNRDVRYGMRLMLAAMAGAAGLVGSDWLEQLRAAVAEPLSDRARQAVEYDSDVMAAWESRRPEADGRMQAAQAALDHFVDSIDPAELGATLTRLATEPTDDPDDSDEPMVGGSLSGPHSFAHGMRPW